MYVGPYKICFISLALLILWYFFFPRGFRLQAHLRVSNRHYVVRICSTAYRLKNTEPCSGLGNCLALYFWRSLKCLNYLEVMHWWPHALATPQGYSSQTKTTEFEFNNIPICDIPCSTMYVVFIGLFLGSVVDPMMAEIPGPSVVFFFFLSCAPVFACAALAVP